MVALILWPAMAQASSTDSLLTRLHEQSKAAESASLYRQGSAYLEQGRLDEAFICFTIVAGRYTAGMSPEDKLLCARAMNNAGGIAQLRSSYSTAFSYFKDAIQMADVPLYQSFNNIAGIYLFYNDYTEARRYLTEAFNVSCEQHDWASLENSLHNIIYLNWIQDSVQASAPTIRAFGQLADMPHDERWQRARNVADGMTAEAAGQDSVAISCYMKNLAPPGQGLAYTSIPNEFLYMARLYMRRGDATTAIATLRQAEQAGGSDASKDVLLQVYRMLADCHALMGDSAAVHEARYCYMSLKDSINTAEEYGKIKNIEFFHEVEKYETQVQQLGAEKRTRSLAAIVCGAALLAVAVLLAVTIRQNRRLWASYKNLYRINSELVQASQAPLSPPRRGEAGLPDGIIPPSGGTEGGQGDPGLLERIYEKMADVSFISQPDLTVERLAQAIGTHERNVSAVINEQMNMNFNTLLNEYRIREICKRLTDTEHYGTLTNETIAEGLGYKSRSHFTRTFKKVTGLTPSQYQLIAKMENEGR